MFLRWIFEHAQPSRIFSPFTTDYPARYVAFAAAEDKNPHSLHMFSFEQQQQQKRWEAGLRKIQRDECRDEGAGPLDE